MTKRALTASSRAPKSASSSRPATACSRSKSNSGPSTAAVANASLAASERRDNLRPTTSLPLRGCPTARRATGQRPPAAPAGRPARTERCHDTVAGVLHHLAAAALDVLADDGEVLPAEGVEGHVSQRGHQTG